MQPWTEALLKRLTSGSVHAGNHHQQINNLSISCGISTLVSMNYISVTFCIHGEMYQFEEHV